MTINQRIELIIKEVYSNNKRAFSRDVGISASVTQNIVGKRQSKPTYNILKRITESLVDINKDWVMYGTGEMLVSKNAYAIDEKMKQVADDGLFPYKKNINIAKPFLYSYSNMLTNNKSFSSVIESGLYENIVIPFIENYDFSVKAHGDSMINEENPQKSITNNSIVACRIWKDKSHILWGEVYVLATANGYMIKKIIPSEREGYIKCISFNEKNGYVPCDISLNDVFEWAIVIGVMSVSMW